MKQRVDELAVFGGPPLFDAPLHVGQPNLGDRAALLERLQGALDRRWLTNRGPLVREFEQRVESLTGVEHCVAMCNGTLALEIAIRAAGLSGEVIVPSFTFVATAHALQWQEITPVFCDVDPVTHTMDPSGIEELITERTTGIIGVHTWGRPCDIEALQGIATRHDLALLFDAAHAFGCSYRGKMIGGFGNAEVFSFHATKFVNCIEGGAVVTNDTALANRIRLMKNFGFVDLDTVSHLGTNGKMNEFSAAMGLTTLDSMEAIVEHNRLIYEAYREATRGIPGLVLIDYDRSESQNFQYIVFEVDTAAAGLCRDTLIAALVAENVRARRYFYPGVHRMEPYVSYFPENGVLLPETEALGDRVMVLPTGEAMTAGNVSRIAGLLRLVLGNAAAIRSRLDPRLATGAGGA